METQYNEVLYCVHLRLSFPDRPEAEFTERFVNVALRAKGNAMKDDHLNESDLSAAFGPPAKRMLSIDLDRYQSYLDDANVSESDKRLFIEALWTIVMNFVDLGFGVESLEQSCGQPEKIFDLGKDSDSDGVDSDHGALKFEFKRGPDRQ